MSSSVIVGFRKNWNLLSHNGPGISGGLDCIDKAVVYDLDLYARSYVVFTYADGSTAVFYTGTNERDMKTVATNLAAGGYTNAVVEDILNTFAE